MLSEIKMRDYNADEEEPSNENLVSEIENNVVYAIDQSINDVVWLKEQLSIPYNSVAIRRRESFEDMAGTYGWDHVVTSICKKDFHDKRLSKWNGFYSGGGIFTMTDMVKATFKNDESRKMSFINIFYNISRQYPELLGDKFLRNRIYRELANEKNFIKTPFNGISEMWSIKDTPSGEIVVENSHTNSKTSNRSGSGNIIETKTQQDVIHRDNLYEIILEKSANVFLCPDADNKQSPQTEQKIPVIVSPDDSLSSESEIIGSKTCTQPENKPENNQSESLPIVSNYIYNNDRNSPFGEEPDPRKGLLFERIENNEMFLRSANGLEIDDEDETSYVVYKINVHNYPSSPRSDDRKQ